MVLAQLKLDSSVELSGNETVGDDHHDTGDEEEREEEQHVPEKHK